MHFLGVGDGEHGCYWYLSLIMCICEVYIIRVLTVDKSPPTFNASCFHAFRGYHASIQTVQTKYMHMSTDICSSQPPFPHQVVN